MADVGELLNREELIPEVGFYVGAGAWRRMALPRWPAWGVTGRTLLLCNPMGALLRGCFHQPAWFEDSVLAHCPPPPGLETSSHAISFTL